jgi:hypothetical protein
MGYLDGEQKELIKKLVNFRMKDGKRTNDLDGKEQLSRR